MNTPESYSTYSFEQLIEDSYFQQSVLQTSPESDAFWEKFLVQYPQQVKPVTDAREFLRGTQEHFQQFDKSPEEIEEKLQQVLDRERIKSLSAPVKSHGRRRFIRYAVAASLALLISLAGWYGINYANRFTVHSTQFGEWKTVQLPDGSRVELNANSELRLAKNWREGDTRKVWLKGEAFFHVEKKPSTGVKFHVITDDLTIEVLGTSFNVHSRGEQTEVFLEEGKIHLDMGEEQTYMDPGDFLAYSGEKKAIIQRAKLDNAPYSSWKEGVLEMDNAPVLQILEKIAEIYGVNITVKDSAFMQQERTIGVPMEKLEIVVPILETTLEATITLQDNDLLIE